MRAAALVLIAAFGCASHALAQTPVYRCGTQYADAPCPGAVKLALAPAPTADQVREARTVAQREQQLAERLQRDRQREERDAASRPALAGIAAGPRTRLAETNARPVASTRGKKKGKLGYFADDPKVTQVIEQRAPKKAARR